MLTTLVNVKVAHIRKCGYNDLMEWMADKNNFYIGRPGIVFVQNGDSKTRWPLINNPDTFNFCFCNRHKVVAKATIEERIKAIKLFEKDLDEMLKDPNITEQFKSLKGKHIGCWCVEKERTEPFDSSNDLCHGDVILKKLKTIQ